MDSPFVPWSPWFTMAGNGRYETDLFSRPEAPCTPPGEEVYSAHVTRDSGGRPVLTFQDPNPSAVVTGYNVYRSSAPPGPWTLIGSNVADSYPVAPDIQDVDPNGGGLTTWYFQVAAFNGGCGAEGPW